MKNLSQEYLKECFYYNDITGELIKKQRPRHHFKTLRCYKISIAKSSIPGRSITDTGYITVSIDNKTFYAHRIIWKMQTGEDPSFIDHIDHNRANNAWNNLRNIQREDHNKNLGRSTNNKSGITGVYFSKAANKWVAQCQVDGCTNYLGCYTDIHDAGQAVLEFRMKNNFHENHGQEVREYRAERR